MKGYAAGIVSFIFAIIFLAAMVYSMIYPGSSQLAYGAVVVGVGTIVSVIALGVALLKK